MIFDFGPKATYKPAIAVNKAATPVSIPGTVLQKGSSDSQADAAAATGDQGSFVG